jgi:hypothetical protein
MDREFREWFRAQRSMAPSMIEAARDHSRGSDRIEGELP